MWLCSVDQKTDFPWTFEYSAIKAIVFTTQACKRRLLIDFQSIITLNYAQHLFNQKTAKCLSATWKPQNLDINVMQQIRKWQSKYSKQAGYFNWIKSALQISQMSANWSSFKCKWDSIEAKQKKSKINQVLCALLFVFLCPLQLRFQ